MKYLILIYFLSIETIPYCQVRNYFLSQVIIDRSYDFDSSSFKPIKNFESHFACTDFACTKLDLKVSRKKGDTLIFDLSYLEGSYLKSIRIDFCENEINLDIYEFNTEIGIEVYTHNNFYVLYIVGENEYILSESVYLGFEHTEKRNIYFKIE